MPQKLKAAAVPARPHKDPGAPLGSLRASGDLDGPNPVDSRHFQDFEYILGPGFSILGGISSTLWSLSRRIQLQ